MFIYYASVGRKKKPFAAAKGVTNYTHSKNRGVGLGVFDRKKYCAPAARALWQSQKPSVVVSPCQSNSMPLATSLLATQALYCSTDDPDRCQFTVVPQKQVQEGQYRVSDS